MYDFYDFLFLNWEHGSLKRITTNAFLMNNIIIIHSINKEMCKSTSISFRHIGLFNMFTYIFEPCTAKNSKKKNFIIFCAFCLLWRNFYLKKQNIFLYYNSYFIFCFWINVNKCSNSIFRVENSRDIACFQVGNIDL